MDLERGCIEILFKRIPYDSLSLPSHNNAPSLNNITKDLFLMHAREQFHYYSNDELANIYDFLSDSINAEIKGNSIFDYLAKVACTFLNYATKEPTCKYEQLLRWRGISFNLGQDLFTTSLLAKQDVMNRVERKYFSWRPILRTDNNRLQNILNQGMAENHFHINGSSQNFMLNWISIMNNVVSKSQEKALLFERLSATQSIDGTGHVIKSIYDKIRLAAYYRCYLFACNENDKDLLKLFDDINIKEIDNIGVYAKKIQKTIDICQCH